MLSILLMNKQSAGKCHKRIAFVWKCGGRLNDRYCCHSFKLANNETLTFTTKWDIHLKVQNLYNIRRNFYSILFCVYKLLSVLFNKYKSLHLHSFLMCKNIFYVLFLTNWLSWFLHDENNILSFSLCLFNDLQFLHLVH